MEYKKQGELKVTCIASKEDLEFFGITLEDLLDRTQQGYHFIKKVKELAGMNQKVIWTNVAYTLQIVGQKGMNPTVASLILSLESVVSVIAGFIILKQEMSERELLGCVVMFAAIVLVQLAPSSKDKK